MELLLLLVERRGRLVTRTDIIQRLWGADVLVDVESGVNTAIRKVRHALQDSAAAPKYLETVPGKGYRFVATAEAADVAEEASAQALRAAADGGTQTETQPQAPPPAPAPAPVDELSVATLAVLPFANLGAGPDQEYVADGFTEEAIAALAQIDPRYLRVIGRTSVMRYKATAVSLAEIGRELGVGYLIEGAVRAEGNYWRVTAALVKVPEQVRLWSGTYDGRPSSMLAFQLELASDVAGHMRVQFAPERRAALERRHSVNAEAYDLYLQGRHFWNQLTPATSRLAIERYTKSTVLDPAFALAWSGLADAYGTGPITGDVPPLAVWPLAHRAATAASRTGVELAEAQTSLGLVDFWLNWNWDGAERGHGGVDGSRAGARRARDVPVRRSEVGSVRGDERFEQVVQQARNLSSVSVTP